MRRKLNKYRVFLNREVDHVLDWLIEDIGLINKLHRISNMNGNYLNGERKRNKRARRLFK